MGKPIFNLCKFKLGLLFHVDIASTVALGEDFYLYSATENVFNKSFLSRCGVSV